MAHSTARVISCFFGTQDPTTPVGRVFEGTCALPQNLTNSRAIGGQEDNLYGMIEPRINGLSFEVQNTGLLAYAVRGNGPLPALRFLCGTDQGAFLFDGAYINDVHLRFSGAGTLVATISVMALSASRVASAPPEFAAGPVYQWYDGRMVIGDESHEIVEGVLSFSNNLEYLVHWDGAVDPAALRMPSSIKTDTYETIACRFTMRQPQSLLDGLANAPGTTTASIRATRGDASVAFDLAGLSIAEDELLSIPGGGDDVIEYRVPLHGVHGSLAIS